MREYVVLQTEFWINPQYLSLSLNAHLIGGYLMSCPHDDNAKGYQTAEEYMAGMLSLDKFTIRRAIQELIEKDFLSPDFKMGWKLVHFFKPELNSEGKPKKINQFSRNRAHFCKDI